MSRVFKWFENKSVCCDGCGITEWNGGPIPFYVGEGESGVTFIYCPNCLSMRKKISRQIKKPLRFLLDRPGDIRENYGDVWSKIFEKETGLKR